MSSEQGAAATDSHQDALIMILALKLKLASKDRSFASKYAPTSFDELLELGCIVGEPGNARQCIMRVFVAEIPFDEMQINDVIQRPKYGINIESRSVESVREIIDF